MHLAVNQTIRFKSVKNSFVCLVYMALRENRLIRLPVTQEIAGSSPARVATVRKSLVKTSLLHH